MQHDHATAIGRGRDHRRIVSIDRGRRGSRRRIGRTLLRRRNILRGLTHRQRNELPARGADRANDIAVEVVDLDVLDAIQNEHVDVPIRAQTHVHGIRPRLPQTSSRRLRGRHQPGQAQTQEHAERGTRQFLHDVSPCMVNGRDTGAQSTSHVALRE